MEESVAYAFFMVTIPKDVGVSRLHISQACKHRLPWSPSGFSGMNMRPKRPKQATQRMLRAYISASGASETHEVWTPTR